MTATAPTCVHGPYPPISPSPSHTYRLLESNPALPPATFIAEMAIRYSTPISGPAATAAKVLEAGGSISAAARAAGVSRPTIYAWMKRDIAFQHNTQQTIAAVELARKVETNLLARLAVGALAQILSNDEIPAGVRARVALAVLERGAADSSNWGLPDPVLETDPELPKPAIGAFTAEVRKLYNFTLELDSPRTLAPAAPGSQPTQKEPLPEPAPPQVAQSVKPGPEEKTLYTLTVGSPQRR